MSEREEFLSWVGSVLKDAEIALHNGDAGPRRAIWSQHEPVTVMGAWRSKFVGKEVSAEMQRQSERSAITFFEHDRKHHGHGERAQQYKV